jgi:hypothetical protein
VAVGNAALPVSKSLLLRTSVVKLITPQGDFHHTLSLGDRPFPRQPATNALGNRL